MKKNPPDNTGKKYLTNLTPKQEKFIDLYCSRYGDLSASDCARLAGYEASSAHTRATELLDWRKYPQVRKEIDIRMADSRKLWSIDRDKSLAALFKIKQKADKKGNFGVAAKCEELRAKLGGLFIERIQTMNINKEMSDDQLNDRLLKSFPTKKDWLEGQLATMDDLYPDDDTTVDLAKLVKEVNKKIAEEEGKKKK
jgi:hypothetical protein